MTPWDGARVTTPTREASHGSVFMTNDADATEGLRDRSFFPGFVSAHRYTSALKNFFHPGGRNDHKDECLDPGSMRFSAPCATSGNRCPPAAERDCGRAARTSVRRTGTT